MPLLFSYGTLQHPELQLTTFGRMLDGQTDALPRFELSRVEVTDPQLELAAADGFEKPFAYARTAVRLASAKEAWVYVHAPAQIA